jgi:SAM-dependent methyltransferase
MAGHRRSAIPHKHYLYSASVQCPDADIRFCQRVYRRKRGRPFHKLREDFCGTALLACAWARRDVRHEAWGVDLDRATLEWGRAHWVPQIGKAASRLHLERRNVLDSRKSGADVVAALNFSYSVFKTRAALLRYFQSVRRSLAPGGVFVLDIWGGTETMGTILERRRVPAETAFDGTRVPAFTYIWEQAAFNPVDHHILCHIHFHLRGGKVLRKAFTYDWRLWTLPELQELLAEAGFGSSEVYVEGWDDDEDEGNGIFLRRRRFDNDLSWVAYVVAYV